MSRRGRPMKAGKRKNGRPVPTITYDKGTERAQAMQVFYGTDGADAIGRAYRAGLLGTGDEAKCLLDTARRIAGAYWYAFSTGSYKCPLGDSNSGSVVSIDHERAKRREDWLKDCLRTAETMGVRRQFDQLVIDVNPDCGPGFLDNLIMAKRTKQPINSSDLCAFRNAMKALKCIVALLAEI